MASVHDYIGGVLENMGWCVGFRYVKPPKMSILIILLFLFSFYSCSNKSNKNKSIINIAQNEMDTLYTLDGNTVTIIIKNDSLIIEKNEYLLDKQSVWDTITNVRTKYEYVRPGALGGKWVEFYSDGNVKAKGQSAEQFGCWMNVGDFEYYDSDGVLLKILTYDNWLENENDGCHSTIVNMDLIEYYNNGNVKAEKHYQSGYEDITFDEFYNNPELEEEYKSGNWKFYNIDGKIVKIEKYKTRWKKGSTQ